MFFKRKKGDDQRWNDIDWCDRHVHATTLSDDDLIRAAQMVCSYSTAMVELLDEAARRRLTAILPIARVRLGAVEPSGMIAAIGVIQDMGNASDVPRLMNHLNEPHDHYVIAAILDAIVILDPSQADFALEVARRERDDPHFDRVYVVGSLLARLAQALADDFPGLETRLLDWATDTRLTPKQRTAVYCRLAAMPRSQRIENFFVEFCVRDNGACPELTKVVGDALRRHD